MIHADQSQPVQLPEATDKEIVLEVKNLKKFFPIQGGIWKRVIGHVYAVNDVSFKVSKGETIGIVGESGCGKTTLGRTILGLIPVTDGQILFKEMDVSDFNRLPGDKDWRRKNRIVSSTLMLIGSVLFVLGIAAIATHQYVFSNLSRVAELDLITIFFTFIAPILGLIIALKGAGDIAKLSPSQLSMRQKIQIVFQDPHASLNPRMNVRGLLSEPLKVHKIMPDEEIEDYLISLLEEVGLGEMHLDRFPHEFSGGQRQRIVIARALVLQPEVVILDEPTASTDVSVQAKTLNLLKDLQESKDLTYLFISHDLSVIKHMSDRIIVMYLGKAVEIGSRGMFSNPEKIHPYSEALFAAVPVPDPTFEKKKIILGGDVPSPANPPPGCVFHTRCPFALKSDELMALCKTQEPLLKEVAKGHYIACHLYTEEYMHFREQFKKYFADKKVIAMLDE